VCVHSKGKEEKVLKFEKKEKLTEAWKEYKKNKQNVKRVIYLAKGKKTETMCKRFK